jgi:hypothetical protein
LVVYIFNQTKQQSIKNNTIIKPSIQVLPKNYDECKQIVGAEYNNISCSLSSSEVDLPVEECLQKGGCNPEWVDGPHGCDITFFNPNIIYPKTFDECLKLGGINLGQTCGFEINASCAPKEEVERIMSACPYSTQKKSKICKASFISSEK